MGSADVRVGIRELRAGVSRYIALVREGEEIIVTDRDTPVALLRPVDPEDPYRRLLEEGLIRQGERRRRPLPEPLEIEDLDLQAFLRDQRR
ncbi:MAG: type II toxin-antitoxin system Phd/YefM family antitoxin [Thermoleophilia bacterium]|jgi:prevent-host-death family protein